MSNISIIALDVGGTSIKSAVVASTACIVGQLVVTPTDSQAEADIILATFTDIIRHHQAHLDPARLRGVAFGFPGPFDYEHGISRITGVAKYEAIYGLNIKAALQIRLALHTLPIVFRNDAEAAIIGEARYGAGRLYRRLIGVTLGTGCGSAFVADGAPVTVGTNVPANGWLYPMLFRGAPADDIFSRRGLEARLRAAGAASLDVKEAAALARQGNITVQQVFRAFGADLGEFLRPYAVNFQAEAVLVLGGIAGAFDLFGAALSRVLPISVLPGQCGAEAGLLGAADMLLNH
jgi:glucokinase